MPSGKRNERKEGGKAHEGFAPGKQIGAGKVKKYRSRITSHQKTVTARPTGKKGAKTNSKD